MLTSFICLCAPPNGVAAVGPSRREPGASSMVCLWVVDAQGPAMAAAAGGERQGVLDGCCDPMVLGGASLLLLRGLCSASHDACSALVLGEEERGCRGGESLLWGFLLPALILLLSGTEGFIPFLCFIWKETLSLWLLLLLVVGVFAEIRPLSPCPPPGAAGSLPPLSDPPERAAVRAGSVYANGPGLSWLVCNDLWLHLYANTNNLLLS